MKRFAIVALWFAFAGMAVAQAKKDGKLGICLTTNQSCTDSELTWITPGGIPMSTQARTMPVVAGTGITLRKILPTQVSGDAALGISCPHDDCSISCPRNDCHVSVLGASWVLNPVNTAGEQTQATFQDVFTIVPEATPISPDVPAIEVNPYIGKVQKCVLDQCVTSAHNAMDYTCADKSRFLMTAEDGSKHCIKLNDGVR